MYIKNKINLKNPLLINLIIVGFVTLLVKLLGLGKESYIGSVYGLSEFLDTYALAILIPAFIQNVFVGAIKNIFIPNYIVEKKTTKQIGSFQSLTLLLILGINSFFAVGIFLLNSFMLEYIFPNHNVVFYKLINKQLLIILPCLFLWGSGAFFSALLEIKNKFFFTSITPIYISLTTLFCVFFFKEFLNDYVLAVGMLSGAFFSFVHLFLGAIHYRAIFLRKIVLNNNMKIMLSQLPAKITSGLLTGINPIVDQFFAAQLITGSVIALAYGEKIPAFGITIVMIALGNVLLPHFSELVTTDIKKAYQELFKILKIAFIISVLFATIIIFFSTDIIQLLFERGSFSKENTQTVSTIQQILLLHIPFFIITRILVKFLTSINKNNFMALMSLISVLINIILNFLLIDVLQVYGLALSTTIVLIINSIIFYWYTIKQSKNLVKR